MQTEGFLIVLKPHLVIAEFESYTIVKERFEVIKEYREAFFKFRPENYRGISRYPLSAYPSLDQKIIQEFEKTYGHMKSDAKARYHFREILNKAEVEWEIEDDEDLLPSLSSAKQVLSLVDNINNWEAIKVSRKDFTLGPNTLGFDIGYWGGDHFSLIADILVTPLWHPPIPEDYNELKQELSNLNENLLFKTSTDAESYKDYYKSKKWAEIESTEGEFCIIKVDSVV